MFTQAANLLSTKLRASHSPLSESGQFVNTFCMSSSISTFSSAYRRCHVGTPDMPWPALPARVWLIRHAALNAAVHFADRVPMSDHPVAAPSNPI